mgnify:CR=1 FL=1
MLSRFAERLYWLGRYVERAENTARLIAVNNNLMLDMPSSADVLWEALLDILAAGADFRSRCRNSKSTCCVAIDHRTRW